MSVAAETDRGFLGLTHNPFVQPEEGFFEQAERKATLEQLRHLSQWSRRVLLVTGPDGIGKSSLYRQLSASLEPRCKAARIHGALVNASREVLMAVAQGFGIAAPPDANMQLLGELIVSHVDEQAASERICVVLLDDADHLEPKAIVELMTLAGQSALQLVFFAEVRLVPAVERVAGRLGLGWHEMRLTAFSEPQTREYLEWRFQQARYRGRLPFTENQVREIQRLSNGLPGKINQMANVLLVKLETGQGLKTDAGFPPVHKALLVMLTVVIGLLYLLWQQNERVIDRLAEAGAGAAVEPGAAQAVASAEPGDDAPLAMPAQEPVADRAGTRWDDEPVSEPRVGTEGGEPAAADASGALDAKAQRDTPGAPGTAAVSAAEPDSTTDDLDRSDPEAMADARAASPPAAAVPADQALTATEQEEVAPVVPQAPRPEPAEPSAATAAGTPRDGRWLLEQPADAYTLQLVTVSSPERAAAFIEAQPDPQDFASYRLARDGRTLHVVVYGVFATRSEADAASRRLPASVGNVQPWLRPLAQVHDAIRTTAQ